MYQIIKKWEGGGRHQLQQMEQKRVKLTWESSIELGCRDGEVVAGAKNTISCYFFPFSPMSPILSAFFSCSVHHVRPLWLWISQTVKLSRWALRGRHYVLVACYLLDFSGFLIELLDQKVNLLLEKWIWFYTVIFVLFAMSLYFCLAGSKWRNKSFTRELLEASSAIQKGCFTCRG